MFNSNNTAYPAFPNRVQYFKEDIMCELLTIPDNSPEMERMLGMMVSPTVKQIDLIATETGYSNEGQKLGGYKLIIEVSLQEKLTYVADEPEQSVHAVHYNAQKSIFITLPEQINGKNVCELFRLKKLKVTPYVEKVYTRTLDEKHLHKCVMLLVNLKVNS